MQSNISERQPVQSNNPTNVDLNIYLEVNSNRNSVHLKKNYKYAKINSIVWPLPLYILWADDSLPSRDEPCHKNEQKYDLSSFIWAFCNRIRDYSIKPNETSKNKLYFETTQSNQPKNQYDVSETPGTCIPQNLFQNYCKLNKISSQVTQLQSLAPGEFSDTTYMSSNIKDWLQKVQKYKLEKFFASKCEFQEILFVRSERKRRPSWK